MVYVIQVVLTACEQDQDRVPYWSCSLAVSKPVWHIPLLCVQWKTPDVGQRKCSRHVEFYSKNQFEKLVHLVGLIIRMKRELCVTTYRVIQNECQLAILNTLEIVVYVFFYLIEQHSNFCCIPYRCSVCAPQPNHTVTPTHIEPEQYNTWNKSTISLKLLKMAVLTFETCWAVNSEIMKQVTSSRSIFIQLSRWCTVR